MEIQVAVRGALQQVPDVFRSAVIFARPRRLSYEEVAEVLECSIRTVKSRIFVAARAGKDLLERCSATESFTAIGAPTNTHGAIAERSLRLFRHAFHGRAAGNSFYVQMRPARQVLAEEGHP